MTHRFDPCHWCNKRVRRGLLILAVFSILLIVDGFLWIVHHV